MRNTVKIIRLLLINISLFFAFFILLDYISYKTNIGNSDTYNFFAKKNFDFSKYKAQFNVRAPLGLNYTSKSIIVSGCSFAYGVGLNENETFSANISNLLKRPVYNIGTPGASVQHALLYIRSGEYNKIIMNSEYFIYIFIGDHFLRTIGDDPFDFESSYPVMKKKNNNLVLKYSIAPIFEYSYYIHSLKDSIMKKLLICENTTFEDYLFDLVKFHFFTLYKELKNINPDIKMIILIYPDNELFENILYSDRWEEYNNQGINTINIGDYLPEIFNKKDNKIENNNCYGAEKYCIIYDGHPNALANKKLADLVVNKLHLIK